MAMKWFTNYRFWAAAITGIVVFIVLTMPVGDSKEHSRATACLSNLKQLSQAMLLYENEQERLPQTSNWMDATLGYIKHADDESSPDWKIKCPGITTSQRESQNFGYAMKSKLGGINSTHVEKPETEALVFDSLLLAKNATTNQVAVPNFERHAGIQNAAYLDGHAKRLKQLR